VSTGLPTPPPLPSVSSASSAEGARGRSERASRRVAVAERWARSPSLGAREIILAALTGIALAIITSWPLVLHMGSHISPDLGDPVRTAWQIAWVGHAMLNDPAHLFDSNAFYPHPLSLAFSDSLIGYGPAAWFGSGTVAALVRYNLLFLWAWSFAFFGAYLLARELGLGKIGAFAGGAAFAYAPYRVTEAGHLHVISSGGLPFALFLLLRGYRRSSPGLVFAGWAVTAWQISLGFTLSLQFTYLLAVLGAIAIIYWWRGRGTPGAPPAEPEPGGTRSRGPLMARRVLLATLVGVGLCGIVGIYQSRPYLKISQDYPNAKRSIKEVKNYSSGPIAWFAASSENRIWGPITSFARKHVHSQNEDVFFPGGVIFVLAVIGLMAPFYTKRLRIGLAAGIVIVSVLALGFGLTGGGWPYKLLYDFAPGWNGVRVPGRIFTLATLFYAMLAGAGVQLLAGKIGGWGERNHLRALPAILGTVLVLVIVGEGAGHLSNPKVPQPAAAEIGLRSPILDLPTDGANDRIWQYFSTNGFYKIPVGNSTFDIESLDDLRGGMSGFPDKASIEKLRYYGIKTVVLHTVPFKGLPATHSLVVPEPGDPAKAAEKPVTGLGVTRRRVGSLVIYEIGPGPSALHGAG